MNRSQKKLSLRHLVRYPPARQNPEEKHPAILALHGRGSNEGDLIGLSPFLPLELMWISPRGKFRLGVGGYEWYQVIQVGKPDPTRLANILHTLDQFVDEILEAYPIDVNKLYLLGFSQGSIVSMSYALTRPQRVAGVIAQSGYIPHESGLQINETGLKQKPFLLIHGTQDPVLPVDWARRSRDTLQNLGADIEYHEFDMGHTISTDSLAAVTAWIQKRLA